MQELVESLIGGVVLGSTYTVIALGFSLIYGVSRVLNYAYGSFFTWGAYIAWLLAAGMFQLGYPLVFLIVIPVMFVWGMAVEKLVIHPLRLRPGFDFNALLATLGLALLLDNAAQALFGARTKSLPTMIAGTASFGGYVLSFHDLFVLVFSVSVVIALMLFLGRSRLGMSMVAVAQDPVGAQIVGIPIDRVFGYAFGLSAVLAGIGGILLAPKFYISPMGGWAFLIKALIVVVLGSLGSMKGTLVSAFLLGITENLVGLFLGLLWGMPCLLLLLLIALTFRPQGLFGQPSRR